MLTRRSVTRLILYALLALLPAFPAAVQVRAAGPDFNDYEDMAWHEELEMEQAMLALLPDDPAARSAHVTVTYINMALNGNALAAARLAAGDEFGVPLPDTGSILDSPAFWEDYADSLVSPGWAAYMKASWTVKKHPGLGAEAFTACAAKGHPACLYWRASRQGGQTDEAAALIRQSAGLGYAYARARLADMLLAPGADGQITAEAQKEALDLLKASAGQGEPYGLARLAAVYLSGLPGQAPDYQSAMFHYLCGGDATHEGLRPGALSHPDASGDLFLMDASFNGMADAGMTEEQIKNAFAMSERWLEDFQNRLKSELAAVRIRRKDIAQKTSVLIRDEYLKLYTRMQKSSKQLPASLH